MFYKTPWFILWSKTKTFFKNIIQTLTHSKTKEMVLYMFRWRPSTSVSHIVSHSKSSLWIITTFDLYLYCIFSICILHTMGIWYMSILECACNYVCFLSFFNIWVYRQLATWNLCTLPVCIGTTTACWGVKVNISQWIRQGKALLGFECIMKAK